MGCFKYQFFQYQINRSITYTFEKVHDSSKFFRFSTFSRAFNYRCISQSPHFLNLHDQGSRATNYVYSLTWWSLLWATATFYMEIWTPLIIGPSWDYNPVFNLQPLSETQQDNIQILDLKSENKLLILQTWEFNLTKLDFTKIVTLIYKLLQWGLLGGYYNKQYYIVAECFDAQYDWTIRIGRLIRLSIYRLV